MNCPKQVSFVNAAAAAGLLCFFSGCVLPHKVRLTDTGAPRYKKVVVTYLIGGSHGGLTRDPSQDAEQVAAVSDATMESGANWYFTNVIFDDPP